jgi:pimeloyl-ACP methyl ester carboxylesterase
MSRVFELIPRVTLAVVLSVAGVSALSAQERTIEGRTADGTLYTFVVPGEWNGNLITYVHGIVDPGAPIAVPTTQDGFGALRAHWLNAGYAVAASSFSENGYAVKTAIERTHQLRGLFTAQVGQPDRTYLVGHSLGALAVLALAERYPGQYDGALPVCAPLGGGRPEVQYLGDARVLFDYFFGAVLPGGPFSVPPDTPFAPGTPVFTAALTAITQGLFAADQRTVQFALAARLPFTSAAELVASAMSVAGFSIRFTNDVLDRTHGHVPFDNTQTVYTGSFNDAALNAGVARFSAAPDAVNYFDRHYTPTGDLQVPTLTLHTLWDPVVPFWHEAAYAATAGAAGRSDSLAQRSIARYGHCAVTAAEMSTAFDALVGWVNGGPKPANGDGTIR